MAIDHRRHYVLNFDTETANTSGTGSNLDTSNALVYDCGWSVIDTKGNTYETASYVNRDVFIDKFFLMKSAYFAQKIPSYIEDLAEGKRKLATTTQIRCEMLKTMKKYRITEVVAHNARFDLNSLNATIRYATKSKVRYWFPYDTIIWDTMKMARSVMHKMPTYKKFCIENAFLTATGQLSTTAEDLYRFIIKDPSFKESHTGLEDSAIESQIMFYCYRQHKPMKKLLFENQQERPKPTPFQMELAKNLKNYPTIF